MSAERQPELKLTTGAFGISDTGQLNQLPLYDLFARRQHAKVVVLVFVKNDFSDNSAVIQAINHGLAPAHMPKLFARRNAAGQMELQPIDPHWSNFMLPRYEQTPGRLRAWLLQQSKFYRWIEENAWRVRLLLGRWWYGPSAVAYDLKIDHRNIARLCQSLQPVKSQTRTVFAFHGLKN